LSKNIFIISDATGLTAETVVKAILLQFKTTDVEIKRLSSVRSKLRLIESVQLASKMKGIIIHTLVSQELRDILFSESSKYGVLTVDLIGPMMKVLEDFLETPPMVSPGLRHELSKGYFRGIDCIEYTINHDDGRDPDGLYHADIVIVGVSRTSKTPLSIFLSYQYSLRVANVPVILGVNLPKQLFNLDSRKIVGLTISPKRLTEIRKARIKGIKYGSIASSYADYDQILEELEYSHLIFASRAWTLIDVTEKSVEEVASEIMDLYEYL